MDIFFLKFIPSFRIQPSHIYVDICEKMQQKQLVSSCHSEVWYCSSVCVNWLHTTLVMWISSCRNILKISRVTWNHRQIFLSPFPFPARPPPPLLFLENNTCKIVSFLFKRVLAWEDCVFYTNEQCWFYMTY